MPKRKLITFDWALKKLLRSKANFGILEGFLSELLKEAVQARGLKQAKEKLDIMKLPEEERRAFDRYADDLHYQASMVDSSYGMGRLKGREEGIEEGIKKVAGSLLDVLDDATISNKTGLSMEEVRRLRLQAG